MSGLKKTLTPAPETGAGAPAVKSETDWARVRASKPYVWDGIDEDDRPLTAEEMRAGIEAWREKRKGRGRPPSPAGSQKESTTIRFDREVLDAFKATGAGWQTRMNAALKDWLKTHSPA